MCFDPTQIYFKINLNPKPNLFQPNAKFKQSPTITSICGHGPNQISNLILRPLYIDHGLNPF